MRRCNYRNCDEEIIGRKDKKYCCVSCQRNEKKYRYRKNKLYKNEKEINNK